MTARFKKHLFIDCDPSADDALAIMLALRSPELLVEGITTAAGVCDVDRCTENARRVVAIMGRTDIPVVRGAAHPLSRHLTFDDAYCGADGLSETGLFEARLLSSGNPTPEKTESEVLLSGKMPFGKPTFGKPASEQPLPEQTAAGCRWESEQTGFEEPVSKQLVSKEDAADFLHRKLNAREALSDDERDSGARFHILSIAPMINLAMLLTRYPEDKARIASIVTTSGSYSVQPDRHHWNPRPSWNVKADPEAAKIVLESGIPVYAAGLDVTARLSNELMRRILAEGEKREKQGGACANPFPLTFLKRAVRFNESHGLEPYSLLVDAMGAALCARPDLASFVHGKTAVCTDDGIMLGQTLFGTEGYLDQTESDVYAAESFDFDAFASLLLERVFAG